MKLVIEIEETEVGPAMLAHILPVEREGIPVGDKDGQAKKLARLCELSEMVERTVKYFYL